MKFTHVLAGGLCAAFAAQVPAQTTPAPTLAASMKLSVYPAKGQNATAQGKDEAECYTWSKQQTGYDPANPPATAVAQQAAPPPDQPPTVRERVAPCAARPRAPWSVKSPTTMPARVLRYGAAAGVAAGGARNRQAKREQEAQVNAANQQAQAQADQHNADAAQQLANFKKGMSACLEGKGYVVK